MDSSVKIAFRWVHTRPLSNGTANGGSVWVEEVPGVNAQERTREELLTSLPLILAEALDLNRKEAAGSDFEEETLSA